MGGVAIAQLDPNLREPSQRKGSPGSPLCFPLSTMVFLAGVVKNHTAPISRSIALQIEPHGRLRVIGEELKDVNIRLDGITYHLQSQGITSPKTCVPHCFPQDSGAHNMGTSGCVKACTPPLVRDQGGIISIEDCQCDMIKRLDCWKLEGAPLRCGQFKQLLRMHSLKSGQNVRDRSCNEICA